MWVVPPTHSEADNGAPVVSALAALGLNPRVLVVDGDSPDAAAAGGARRGDSSLTTNGGRPGAPPAG